MYMWKIPRRLLFATSILALSTVSASADLIPVGTAAEAGFSEERLQHLTDVMQSYVDNGTLPGIVVLVAKDGKVAYQHAFGYQNVEAKTPMDMTTVFRIASQTKAVTSAAVLKLQEDGKLLIDDPVGKYLPEWMETTVAVKNNSGGVDIVPSTRPITIRDMLLHTSGIPYGSWLNETSAAEWEKAGFLGWYFSGNKEPIRETVKRMASLPMMAQPGEGWYYGYNSDILGALIEVASGKPLDQYFQESFFDPIGMVDSQFYLPKDEATRLATVYDQTKDGLVPAAQAGAMWDQGEYVAGSGPNISFSGGAGLLSTAADYAAFLEMIRQGGVAPGGKRILSPMTAQLMMTDHLGGMSAIPGAGAFIPKGAGFSYGFQVTLDAGTIGTPMNDGEAFWGGAYHSIYWIDPKEDMVVTYFTQLGDTINPDDQAKFRALIYSALER